MKKFENIILKVSYKTVQSTLLFLVVLNLLLVADYGYSKSVAHFHAANYKPWFKKNASVINVVPPPLLRLKLVDSYMDVDDIAIGFSSFASASYNPNEDSEFFPGSNGPVSLSSLSSDNVKLSINLVPLPSASTPLIIKLDVEAANSGSFSLLRTQLDTLPDKYHLWLVDKLTKDSIDLRNTASYSFNINKTDTTSFGTNRFVVFISGCGGTGNTDTTTVKQKAKLVMFNAEKVMDGAQISWTTSNEFNTTRFAVERSTDNGTTYNDIDSFISNSTGFYNYVDKNPVAGTDAYRLKLTDLNDSITFSSTVLLLYTDIATTPVAVSNNSLKIYPNPAASFINLSITQNNSNSANANAVFDIMIMNSSGNIIKTATSSQALWQDNVNNLIPGTYFVNVVRDNDKSLIGKGKFIKL